MMFEADRGGGGGGIDALEEVDVRWARERGMAGEEWEEVF